MPTIRRNYEKNGIEIVFPVKPAKDVRVWLKSRGFRFSDPKQVWWKKYIEELWNEVNEHFGIPLLENPITSNPELPIGIAIKKEAEKELIKSFAKYLKEAREVYGWKNNEAIHEKYKLYLLRNAYEDLLMSDRFGVGIRKTFEDAEQGITRNLSKVKITDESSWLYGKKKVAELMEKARAEGRDIKELKNNNTMKITDPKLNRLFDAYSAETDTFEKNRLIDNFTYGLAGPQNAARRQAYLQLLTGAAKKPPKAKAGIHVLEAEIEKWIASQTTTVEPKKEFFRETSIYTPPAHLQAEQERIEQAKMKRIESDQAMQEVNQEILDENKVGTVRPYFGDVIIGREIQISMPNGEKRNAVFAIVELDNIIASHNEENFHSEPLYPKNASGNNINDRNYKDDQGAQKQVMDAARELEPERVITTSRTPSGTPIITKDGFVVSGNQRTMSLKLAAKNYPENYKQYVDYLIDESSAYGFDIFSISSFEVGGSVKCYTFRNTKDINDLGLVLVHPVLVRIDYDFPEYTTQELAKYNKDTKKSERPIDKAIKLSNILRDNSHCADIIAATVGEYETFSEFYVNIVGQKRLAKTLVECNLLTEQELPAYFSETTFTETGKEFIENLLAALILDREALMATEQPGVKSTRQKLLTSLPVLMKNASLPEGSLKQKINDAVILQYNMKGSTFADFIRQRTMFGTMYDRKTVYLNRLIDSGKIKFKQAIEGYNEAIMTNQGASLFGEKPSMDEIFDHWIVGGVSETDKKLIESSDVVRKEEFKLTPEQKAIIKPEWDKMQEFLKEKPEPKFKVGDYVRYKQGDVNIEHWYGIIKEVRDLGKEYVYRIDGYGTNEDNQVMFDSAKTNEKYEPQLTLLGTVSIFENLKKEYEESKNKTDEDQEITEKPPYPCHNIRSYWGQQIEETLREKGWLSIKDVYPVVTEKDYWLGTDGTFEPSSEEEFKSIDISVFRSDSRSKYKIKNGILYRGSDHWGKVASCNWYSPFEIKPWQKGGWFYFKIPLSELKRNNNILVESKAQNKESMAAKEYFTKSNAPDNIKDRFGISKTQDRSIIEAVPKTFDSKLPDIGEEVYIVDGKYIRDNIYSDFSQGGNDMAYPEFVPIGELWVEKDMLAEKDHILRHEKRERDLMINAGYIHKVNETKALTYEKAHKIVKDLEDKERGIEAKKEVRNEPEPELPPIQALPKKYAKLKRDYNGKKAGTSGVIMGRPNMFVTDVFFEHSKTNERIDNTYLEFLKEPFKEESPLTRTDPHFKEAFDSYAPKKTHPYIAMYKGKKYELYAEAIYPAQLKAAEFFKVPAKDSYKVDVYLAEESKEDIKKREAKEQPKDDIAEVRLQKLMLLRKFISVSQHKALSELMMGEEREAGFDIVDTLGGIIQTMPHTYQTEDTKTNDKIVYLHYFKGGSDWYIVEKDKLPVQQQAFGYAILNGDDINAEWGYINIVELIQNNVELDFYFTPVKFGELKKKWQGNEDDDRDELEQVTDEINEMFEGATTEETKQYDDDTESEEKKIFGYEFMFQPANNDGLQLMSTLQGFGIIIGVLDYPNGISLEYRTEKYELLDNSGEFKLSRIGSESYPYVIDFKEKGKLKTVFELAKEIEDNIIADLKKKPTIQPERKPETFGEAIENIKNDPYRLNKVIEELLDRKWNDKDWTAEQLEFIKGYSGYGGLNDESEKAGEKLDVKSLFEFYTPDPVIEKMWGLAYKYGYNEGRLCEPSAGIGLFLKREYVKSSVIKDAYEINKYSAKIIKLLYPEANVNDGEESKYFEQLFIKNNYTVRKNISPVHDLVIGNPPYGAAEGLYMGMGEKTYTHATNYVDYFILRGLDLLVDRGLLIYIIGVEVANGGIPFLDKEMNKTKEMIAKRGSLIDAYRLPSGIFSRTDVVSDIVVFRKKELH